MLTSSGTGKVDSEKMAKSGSGTVEEEEVTDSCTDNVDGTADSITITGYAEIGE